MMNIALICGGPSKERGISLNSARSFLDHASALALRLTVLYVNPKGLYYCLTPGQLYSNTPADFDFKLSRSAHPIKEKELIALLSSMDLVFPMIHGTYGEDGSLQEFLEKHQIPHVGSSSAACKRAFNKHRAANILQERGFATLPSLCMQDDAAPIAAFWHAHHLRSAIIKPTESGSSLGVHSVESIAQAKQTAAQLFREGFSELLLEPFAQGTEFTICVLENNQGIPVSLMPLEIENKSGTILDYRRKYLPSEETRYHCPPRFTTDQIAEIRDLAERIFKIFGLRDFARLDGWLTQDGAIRFSDFNPISGMEQNSFLFQQAAQAGIAHTDLLEYVLTRALARYGKHVHLRRKQDIANSLVYVLMGGETAERHVSLMSGTNVVLKLRQKYQVEAFLLGAENHVWKLPYAYLLHHTADEVAERCQSAHELAQKALPFVQAIREKLGLSPLAHLDVPERLDLESLLKIAKKTRAFMFLALHGGIGEDGTIQKLLEKRRIPFNGSGSKASQRNMDKYKTASCIARLKDPDILPMPQISFPPRASQNLWRRAQKKLGKEILVKPRSDGCSSGVIRLASEDELSRYIGFLQEKQIPPNTFTHQKAIVMMPASCTSALLLEPFIETDRISIVGTEICHEFVSGWCEMTIAVLEKQGIYTAFNPSITVASGSVLSVEEKFQGGTGVNLTPPPLEILSEERCAQVKHRACLAARSLGIQNYARLDLFVECKTGRIRIIEANTLPALTPSTVLYHQALAESPPMAPLEFLNMLIINDLQIV